MSDQNNFNQSQENSNQPGAYYDGSSNSNSTPDYQAQFNQQFRPQGNVNNNPNYQNNPYSQQPYPQNDPSQGSYQGQNSDYNPYPNQNYNYSYGEQQKPPQTTDAPAIVSLICGILSVITCCLGPLALILSIIGVISGISSKKVDGKKNGAAIAGIIICTIMLIVSIVVTLFYIDSYKTFEFNIGFDRLFEELENLK